MTKKVDNKLLNEMRKLDELAIELDTDVNETWFGAATMMVGVYEGEDKNNKQVIKFENCDEFESGLYKVGWMSKDTVEKLANGYRKLYNMAKSVDNETFVWTFLKFCREFEVEWDIDEDLGGVEVIFN